MTHVLIKMLAVRCEKVLALLPISIVDNTELTLLQLVLACLGCSCCSCNRHIRNRIRSGKKIPGGLMVVIVLLKKKKSCWSGWHGGGRRSEMRAWMCTAGEMR